MRPARLAYAAALAVCLARSAAAEAPRAVDGLAPPEQAAAYMASWSDAVRTQVFMGAGRGARFVTPCARGLTEAAARAAWGVPPDRPVALDPLRLLAPGVDLAARHAGDFGCALIEAGFWPVHLTFSGEGRLALTLVQDGARELLVEFETADPLDAAEITVDAVSLVAPQRGGRPIVLRPRPADAADHVGRREAETRELSAAESLGALAAMAGLGTFDLAAAGVATEASRAEATAAAAAEPGCAETGACVVPPCGPARRDSAALREALYSPEDKAMICETLAAWRTERHPPGAPDARIVRRALVMALQDLTPEEDVSEGIGRVVTEHSLSGTRFIVTNTLGVALMGLPLQAQTVRAVEVGRCRGDDARRTCEATAEVELFSRAVNMPESVQKALVEAMLGPPRTYEARLSLDFVRRNARWELEAPRAVAGAALDWSEGLILKGPAAYFIEDVERLAP
ncbi:hypothetical protein [Rubrimonas cliftonensis]|uniref:Uncharacterized protein n=1 Tax=Rubrimonas cliftonensis TaxID=89524 RepID=A0A1H4F7U0_9RHOB|nr:hypothetical protein [Rubrimonas cliftonensis]SEA93435.1 hypothetical protein SAMN05444370_11931 [Rubrimonas cliftonensis]